MKKKKERVFSSNAVRLSGKELLITGIVMSLAVFYIFPWLWSKSEKLVTDKDFRLGYDYRDDYWVYREWVEKAAKKYPILFLGDSVVWGMYVDNESTLPAKINRDLGSEAVANLAIDGLHPVALEGLLEYYGDAIRNKKIILHYNPLWMNSKRFDLSGKEEMEVHHPRLIPQFSGNLDCYRENFGKRMSVWCERNLPFYSLLNHIRIAFFNNENFNQWVIDHPYSNPLSQISLTVNAGEKNKSNSTINWTQKGITEQNWSWVPLAESKQWQAFKRVVQLLERNHNELLVMVGPINPYLLSPESLKQYRCLQQDICQWLDQENIEYFLVPDMPSEVYADASHPLARGYSIVAGGLAKKIKKR